MAGAANIAVLEYLAVEDADFDKDGIHLKEETLNKQYKHILEQLEAKIIKTRVVYLNLA